MLFGSKKQLLFVGGNPRSGTTALWRLLNGHPEVFIGVERYFRHFEKRRLRPFHFRKGRFLNIKKRDTHEKVSSQFDDREKASAAYDRAKIVGDKMPPIVRYYDMIWERFPASTILYILREPLPVAESYQKRKDNPDDGWNRGYSEAIDEWNHTVAETLRQIEAGRKIIPVLYERLFSSRSAVDAMFKALGLDPAEQDQSVTDAVLGKFQDLASAPASQNEDIRREVAERALMEPYRKIAKHFAIGDGSAALAATG